MFESGDILRKGGYFYRIYDINPKKHEIIFNKVIWNPLHNHLEIFHDYEFCKFDEVGDGKLYTHIKSTDPVLKELLEIPKRKYKIQKLNDD